jgi:hypothetical protein
VKNSLKLKTRVFLMRSRKMSEKNSRLCKCGSLADFIKDYWVTEMKSKKDEYESSLMIPKEKVCGIIRRRCCKKCKSFRR